MKSRSNVGKGNYYKKKTKDWFLAQGYKCEYLESLRSIWTPKGFLYKKNDLFASDGLAISDTEIIFWNSKGGAKENINQMITEGIKKYQEIHFPHFVKRQIIAWIPRAREPQIINI